MFRWLRMYNFIYFLFHLCFYYPLVEIPPEVLFKQFIASYSAARGALNEFWRSCGMMRGWFIDDFCQPPTPGQALARRVFAQAVRGLRIRLIEADRICSPDMYDRLVPCEVYGHKVQSIVQGLGLRWRSVSILSSISSLALPPWYIHPIMLFLMWFAP